MYTATKFGCIEFWIDVKPLDKLSLASFYLHVRNLRFIYKKHHFGPFLITVACRRQFEKQPIFLHSRSHRVHRCRCIPACFSITSGHSTPCVSPPMYFCALKETLCCVLQEDGDDIGDTTDKSLTNEQTNKQTNMHAYPLDAVLELRFERLSIAE